MLSVLVRRMSVQDSRVLSESSVMREVRTRLVPDFSADCKSHKGQAGRVGVVGGSAEYTGAPYFAALSALRTGCDLAHVFCLPQAAPVIKAYSPDLIVHPILGYSDRDMVKETMGPWLPRLHVVIIGPGLGRDPTVLEGVGHLVDLCRAAAKPLIVDADGLWLATLRPDLFKDYPAPLVLTPNAPEFERLVQALKDTDQGGVARTLGTNTVVLRKGHFDLVEGALGEKVECSATGSWRRCGGQGDLLAGSLGTFLAWELYQQVPRQQTGVLAAYAACRLTRELARRAFEKRGRSMCASDMLLEIHDAFTEIFGV